MDYMTWDEFNNLKRHKNGRIVDLPLYFYRLTDEQVNMLVGDDRSYCHELQEEVAYEMSFYRGDV